MEMLGQINLFVKKMLEQKQQFEEMQNQVAKQQNQVQDIIKKLGNREKELVSSAKKDMKGSEDEEIQNIFDVTSSSLEDSILDANQKIFETVKGMKFIQDFDKRFTIAVFGKVKAGKSYIGNFVMGTPLKNLGLQSAYDEAGKIVVHVYDRGNTSTQEQLSEISDEGEDFATGTKETTNSIQWFELGALSWFDTPGIGSVTWETECFPSNTTFISFSS